MLSDILEMARDLAGSAWSIVRTHKYSAASNSHLIERRSSSASLSRRSRSYAV